MGPQVPGPGFASQGNKTILLQVPEMKTIVAVLVESPLYFTLSLQDRYGLVKRLMDRENNIDLSAMHHKLRAFLTVKPQGS